MAANALNSGSIYFKNIASVDPNGFVTLGPGTSYADVIIVRKNSDRAGWGMAVVSKDQQTAFLLKEDLHDSLVGFFEDPMRKMMGRERSLRLSELLLKASQLRKCDGLENLEVVFLSTACQQVYDENNAAVPITKSLPPANFNIALNDYLQKKSFRIPSFLPCPPTTRKMCVEDETGQTVVSSMAEKCRKGTTSCARLKEKNFRMIKPLRTVVVGKGGGTLKAVIGALGILAVLCSSVAPR